MSAIVTSYVHPPVPYDHFDWRATRKDYEPGDHQGWGATEAKAIADLLEKEES